MEQALNKILLQEDIYIIVCDGKDRVRGRPKRIGRRSLQNPSRLAEWQHLPKQSGVFELTKDLGFGQFVPKDRKVD